LELPTQGSVQSRPAEPGKYYEISVYTENDKITLSTALDYVPVTTTGFLLVG